MMRRAPRTRGGLTLIEVIVVLAILGLLIALILPAVQSAREASRRAACRANLAQIGQALNAFHATNNQFPTNMVPHLVRFGRPSSAHPAYSIHFQLLPYLEQTGLYEAFNVPDPSKPAERDPQFPHRALGAFNITAASTRLSIFLCPSDRPLRPGVNYRGCVGPHPTMFDEPNRPGGTGAFVAFRYLSARDFADGLSQTVGFSERVAGRGLEHRFDPRRDIWHSGVNLLLGPNPSNDQIVRACSSPVTDPPYWPFAGHYWVVSGFANSLYNHVSPPNAPWPDCSGHPKLAGEDFVGDGSVSARSLHRDGVNVLMMDGSVKSVTDSVDLELWRAVSTRAGREVVTLD